MGCLLALLAGFAPRVALVLIWIFTNLVDRAFTGFLIPLLGLILFPYATLFYVLAWSPVGGVSGWGWFGSGWPWWATSWRMPPAGTAATATGS